MGGTYFDKLRDPRWQKKRLEILERDKWKCQLCFDDEHTLHVHHKFYEYLRDPWDYPDESLVTLCESCHENEMEIIADAGKFIFHKLRKRLLAGNIVSLGKVISKYQFKLSFLNVVDMFEIFMSDDLFHEKIVKLYRQWIEENR